MRSLSGHVSQVLAAPNAAQITRWVRCRPFEDTQSARGPAPSQRAPGRRRHPPRPGRRALTLLTALGTLTLAPPAAAVEPPGPTDPSQVHPEWGRTAGHDARIRKGCRSYAYDYAITPPDGYWSLETFLVGPGGTQYGSGYFLTGHDPLAGPATFRLCRRSTPAGRYTIRARVTVGDDFTGYADGWLPDSTFRLRKPR